MLNKTDQNAIIKICKDLGCCNACCLRYIGIKNPTAYENSSEFIQKYFEGWVDSQVKNPEVCPSGVNLNTDCSKEDGGDAEVGGIEGPVAKRPRPADLVSAAAPISAAEAVSAAEKESVADTVTAEKTVSPSVVGSDACVSCIGVLQANTWPDANDLAADILRDKGYDCETFACALSAPIATILREKAVALHLAEALKQYDEGGVTPLKEAWKWSAGAALAAHVGLALDSGAVAPLLLTVTHDYPDEEIELEVLAGLGPGALGGGGGGGGGGRRRLGGGAVVTRRAAEQAAARASLARLRAAGWARPPRPAAPARARAVCATHAPLYLGGRYVKLSRALPQTPWVVRGERVMPSSVQEVIFEPLARALGLAPAAAEARLKFMSAGREDVDVRCLGTGRPFAVEVADPRRVPSAAELSAVCADVARSGLVRLHGLVPISREQLAELKRGEETKCKTYEALCIKLAHSPDDLAEGAAGGPRVTARDVARVSAWAGGVEQRTPLRVLHRRPLLARRRGVARLHAAAVAGHPALLALRVRTDAGTYIKEWAHGDLRRTRPALAHLLRAPADILALDVTHVHLDWP